MLKIIKRTVTHVLLCAAILLSSAACAKGGTSSVTEKNVPENLTVDISGNVKGSPIVERSYTTLNAENNSLLDYNPGRGFRGIIEFYHFNYTDDEIETHLQKDIDKFTKYTACSTYVLYLYPGDYLGAKLSDEFFKTTQKIFDYLRENKIQVLLRFAYFDVNTFNKRTPQRQGRKHPESLPARSPYPKGSERAVRPAGPSCRPAPESRPRPPDAGFQPRHPVPGHAAVRFRLYSGPRPARRRTRPRNAGPRGPWSAGPG